VILTLTLPRIPVFGGEARNEEEILLDEKEDWKILKRIAESENGDFMLEGIVVDEEGNILKDVKLTITTTKSIPFDVISKERTIKINGRFVVKARDCNAVTLEFWKEGYFRESKAFVLPSWEGNREEIEAIIKGRIKKNTFINRNIKVVMEKIGPLPKLIKYNSHLKYYTGGKAIILDFYKGMQDTMDLKRGMVKVEDLLSAIRMNLLPEGSLYIIPEHLDGRGEIIPVRKNNTLLPPKVRLVINHPEGGLILFNPPEKRKYDPFSRYMKEAPEEGYEKEVLLTPVIYTRMAGEVFFYFKIGDIYGKGAIGKPSYSKDYRIVDTYIKCALNPTGDRNLRTTSRY